MAKRAKMTSAAPPQAKGGITKEELLRIIGEASRQKALASEYQGHHGKVISSAVERWGLEKNALTFVRRLKDMEEGKRQSVLRALIVYADMLEMFASMDAFDDLIDAMEVIVKRARDRDGKPSGGADPVVSQMIN